MLDNKSFTQNMLEIYIQDTYIILWNKKLERYNNKYMHVECTYFMIYKYIK